MEHPPYHVNNVLAYLYDADIVGIVCRSVFVLPLPCAYLHLNAVRRANSVIHFCDVPCVIASSLCINGVYTVGENKTARRKESGDSVAVSVMLR